MTQALEPVATEPRVGSASFANERRGDARGPSGRAATAQLIALPDLHATPDEQRNADAPPVVRDWNPLHQIKTRVQVCVGEASLTVGELLSAKQEQVLCLDRSIEQAVDLTIEGKVVARGQLVAVDDHFAVRITELPVALGLVAGS